MNERSSYNLAVGEDWSAAEKTNCSIMPEPPGSAYVDRLIYRSVHFYGRRLCEPLGEAVNYLKDIERINGGPPFVASLHHQYSRNDDESQLTWQVTLIIGFP